MLLRALKDVPSSVCAIPVGKFFHEMNEEVAKRLIATGFAEEPRKQKPAGRTSWAELDWNGGDVVILGSGESFSEEQAEAAKVWRNGKQDRYAIAINTTFMRAPWVDVIYACDGPWWDAKDKTTGRPYVEMARETGAALWTQDAPTATKYGIKHIRSQSANGLGKTPGLIHQGANGGYQAINLAWQAGAARVYLLGFDMRGGHWHGDHPAGLNKRTDFAMCLRNFSTLAADVAKESGFEVINCSPNSALKRFPMADWREVFA